MSRVPGTFKNRPAPPRRDLSDAARGVERLHVQGGALACECWLVGDCTVVCAREPVKSGEYRWHVSIAHHSRYPSWDEIKTAVYAIPTVELPPGRTFAQLLGNPAATEAGWVNRHENCFHLYEIEDPLR